MKNNVAEYLLEAAEKYPDRKAISCRVPGSYRKGKASYNHLTFSKLNQLSDTYASQLQKSGVKKGMKSLIMLRPGFDFIAVVFAAFKAGAVPVLIDPGMGRRNLLNCIKKTCPEVMIAVSEAHWIKLLFPGIFKSVRISFAKGKFSPLWIQKINSKFEIQNLKFEIEKTSPSDIAAIVFTTGSTGPPKGVVYTHSIFMAQLDIIKKNYGAGPDEIDMPAFPLFALFSAAIGMSCVIPDMDPSRPAEVNPERVIEAVTSHKVTFSFGSPALWRKVSSFCIENNIRLPSLKKVLMAGAPVSADIHQMVKKIISEDGETFVPYGATESLPIANFTGSEMLADTAGRTAEGAGYCVGYPIEGITIKVIEPRDEPISVWNNNLELPNGEIGEIVIKGPVVTPNYYNEPEQTATAKIAEDGKIWHRIGDMGYFDKNGRLWFCGRKAHRVILPTEILYPVCCEAIFNRHPNVYRTALVGIPRQGLGVPPSSAAADYGEASEVRMPRQKQPLTDDKGAKQRSMMPVLIVEPLPGKMPKNFQERQIFISELKELGREKPFTQNIHHFLFHPSFPVDIRHNTKIFREELAAWAERKSV